MSAPGRDRVIRSGSLGARLWERRASAGSLGAARTGAGFMLSPRASDGGSYAGATSTSSRINRADRRDRAHVSPFTGCPAILSKKIVTLELPHWAKVPWTWPAGRSSLPAIYSDPYQVLAPYAKALWTLARAEADKSCP